MCSLHIKIKWKMSEIELVIEHKGKRYPVVGESVHYYICTDPWEEEFGDTFVIPKNESKIIEMAK